MLMIFPSRLPAWAVSIPSMKVMRFHRTDHLHPQQRLDVVDIHRRLIALGSLEQSLREQERFAGDDQTQPVKCLPLHEQIGDTRFVLQTDEAMPLGGAGPLAADHHARHFHGDAVGQVLQVGGAEDSPAL